VSIGDAIRGLIDPLHPAVRAWLQRELPRLVREGYLDEAQADMIARRYGVRLGSDVAEAAPAGAAHIEEAPPPRGPAPGSPTGAGLPSAGPTSTIPPVGSTVGPSVGASAAPSVATGPRVGMSGASLASDSAPAAGRAAVARPAASPFLADHAVSIVLYLGAFLVVAAVVIFLAYSWGDISGGAKLAVLAVLTAGFLGAAWLCLPRQAVRPAGRTFLALGAILVPANVAATYLVYFEDSPIPGAVFWLLGALISGSLHAALSVRLDSRAYGVLATLAAAALAWLLVPPRPRLEQAWVLGPAGAAGLVATLAAARWSPPIPLAQAARAVASALLPVAFLVSLPFLEEPDPGQLGTPISLLLMSGGLAWEAMRGGRTWWIGAVAALLMALPVAVALAEAGDRSAFVGAVLLSSVVTALTARRLPSKQHILWGVAAIVPALIYPFAAWDEDWACVGLFAGLALVTAIVAWGWRSSLPLYATVIAVDGAYVKLLDIYGSPDSPIWVLGAALWPLGAVWALLGATLPRRLSGPCWLGALLTLLAATVLTWDRPAWGAGIAATGAVSAVVAAWRSGLAPVLLLAVPWLLLGGYQGADALGLELHWRWVVAGLTGWLLFAVSLLRPPGEGAPSRGGGEHGQAPDSSSSVAASGDSGGGGVSSLARRPIVPAVALEWAPMARIGAVAVAGFAALLLLVRLDAGDLWLVATVAAWLGVALMLAAWAALARSRDLAVLAALAVVPALFAAIERLHPADGQAFAVPIGLYLLAVAALARRDRRPGRPWAASAIAALGLLVLLGTGIVQSLDRDRFGHALLTLVEGLALVGIGIAIRWRVLVVGGVAGTVVIVVRQLFDAVAALPGWAILGGSGLLLLGIAVALLLARARLAAAGRGVAERWSSWD
jgi:hypothetical protein